jgi:S-formylglutathione hydrolase FrmB
LVWQTLLQKEKTRAIIDPPAPIPFVYSFIFVFILRIALKPSRSHPLRAYRPPHNEFIKLYSLQHMKKQAILLLLLATGFTQAFPQKFNTSFPASVLDKPFTGHIILYLSKENRSPRDAFVGLDMISCASVYVENISPGQEVLIDDKAVSYPVALSGMERGEYYVQIVWDRNLGGRSIGSSPGNLFNNTSRVNFSGDLGAVFPIICDQVNPSPSFKETTVVKELKAPSVLLSSFQKRPVTVDAAVLLPREYQSEPNRKFPVLFYVFGYGGDYHALSGDTVPGNPIDTIACIRVYLDGNCPLGHSVYANSDNNGPWGDALTQEFIPLLERTYRCNGARLLTGHSSGGWTVFWLQTHYPKVFAGCTSSSPDPVDFRSFQKVNLYEDKNIFYDKDSALRLVATVAGFFPWATMKTIYQMENVVYRGEQMHSFDAVFSRKGMDGMPERICDPATGTINPNTFSHWKNYDICLYLRTNWDQVKDDLDGKIRVSVGKQDNFLLNYAVMMLEEEMKKIHANLQIAYYPGDHFTVATPEYRKDGINFLAQKYREWQAKNAMGSK